MNKQKQTITVLDTDFLLTIEADEELSVETKLEALAPLEDSFVLEFKLSSKQKSFNLKSLSVNWKLPIVDMQGLYMCGNPRAELSYLPYWQFQKESCANRGIPFLAFVNKHQQTKFAVGLLDQLTETTFQADLSEITRCYHCKIQKPNSDKPLELMQWTERIFISKRQALWSDILGDYREWVDQQSTSDLMLVPDAAYDPVFCTWTAIHHELSHDWIMRNARLAADIGFKTWLTDDGWFLKEGQFGNYRFVGDWEPEETKFPDFENHVKQVQALGFKYLLWVAPFMIGDDNERSQRYKHLLTTGQEREEFKNLSPKHPETKTQVFKLLSHLVKDFNLDGLKIDFLDSLRANGKAVEGETAGSFGLNFFNTLKETIDALRIEKPELLIEFRNSYTNLASRAYANLYRSSDVPINPTLNRWQAVMLRLLTPDRAVHLDPALWHPEETDENVALHLINCMVSVPTVSIELDSYPQSHIELLRYWIGFYNQHRDSFINGKFNPVLRQGFIPAVYFETKKETIIASYNEIILNLPETEKIWVLNGSSEAFVQWAANDQSAFKIIERDKFGRIVRDYQDTKTVVSVEVGGSLELLRS